MSFISKEDEKKIIEAITLAEKQTSGEIKVHIESKTTKPPLERAQEVFYELGMMETAASNGVLFYVGIHDHSFAIIGDTGIDEKVGQNFWESTKDIVITHFKKKEYTQGLIHGIAEAGNALKTYFPYQSDDINELSDEISKS
ncbi:MAG: TPM domain-containing protein [Flavobacteriales bacterium]|nr:TPM domain-containing protein [Flavobacteriales bacterium]